MERLRTSGGQRSRVMRALTMARRSVSHRLIPPTSKITRPEGSNLTTTIRVEYSGIDIFSPACCIFREDNKDWHPVSTPERPYASCLQMITIATGDRADLPMVVRDKREDGSWGVYYTVSIPLRMGINHLSWCREMQLGVYSNTMLREVLEGSDSIKAAYRKEFEQHEGPAIFFNPGEEDTFQAFQLKRDGKYHCMQTDYPHTFTPEYQLEEGEVGIRPPHVHLFVPHDATPPTWMDQIFTCNCTNEEGEQMTPNRENAHDEIDVMEEQHQHHFHLYYAPRARGRQGYTYKTINPSIIDINKRIDHSIEQGCMHALWDRTPDYQGEHEN